MNIDITGRFESGKARGQLVSAQAMDSALRAIAAVFDRSEHPEADAIERVEFVKVRFHGHHSNLDAHVTMLIDASNRRGTNATTRQMCEVTVVGEYRLGTSEPSKKIANMMYRSIMSSLGRASTVELMAA